MRDGDMVVVWIFVGMVVFLCGITTIIKSVTGPLLSRQQAAEIICEFARGIADAADREGRKE